MLSQYVNMIQWYIFTVYMICIYTHHRAPGHMKQYWGCVDYKWGTISRVANFPMELVSRVWWFVSFHLFAILVLLKFDSWCRCMSKCFKHGVNTVSASCVLVFPVPQSKHLWLLLFGPTAPGTSFWQVGYQDFFLCAHPRSNLLLRIWMGGAMHHWVSLAHALQLILFGTIQLPQDGRCQADRDPVVWENANPSKSFWRRPRHRTKVYSKRGSQ